MKQYYNYNFSFQTKIIVFKLNLSFYTKKKRPALWQTPHVRLNESAYAATLFL